MMLISLTFAAFLDAGIPARGTQAEEPQTIKTTPTTYRVPAVSGKIKIDGSLDDALWQQALVLELAYEVEPGANIAPPVKTEVFLLYGSKHLYVGFRAHDPDPSAIRAHVTDRDNITGDDQVGIVLDTFNDSRRSYGFFCNPLGIQEDYTGDMLQSKDQWDGIWNSHGRLNAGGYEVEMAIPFTSLRFQEKKGDQVWGIDAVRIYPRNLNTITGLFPRDRDNNCYMCQAVKVSGFRGARPGINLEFDPTLSAVLTQERESFPDGDFKETSKEVEPGLTARWSINPNLTLGAAVNPDFSHVEADAAQLDINTQFVLFYPEKRPFFLEGAGIFRSRLYAVYTRSIRDPLWGVKLTGQTGKNAFGFFSAQDRVTNLWFPSSESTQVTTLDMNNVGSVLRYRRDIGKSSYLGVFFTDREGTDYFNRSAGVDGDIRLTKKDYIQFQFLGSQTRYPDDIVTQFEQPSGNFTGSVFDGFYRHGTEHIRIQGRYQISTPGYRADLGFVDQTGIKLYDVSGAYIWRQKSGHWFTSISLWGGYLYLTDYNNLQLRNVAQSWLFYSGPLQSSINVHMTAGKRNYLGQEFNDNTLDFVIQLSPSGSLNLWLAGIFGDQVDYSNVRPGTRTLLNPGFQYNIGSRLQFSIDHLYEKLDVEGGKLYSANLSNIRFAYQFSRRAFLRTIFQYADFRYNTALYSRPLDPEFKHLFSQVLFSYKINPKTVLLLGYSDDYYGCGMIPVTQNNRTLFLKIGYALVL